jgi:hypothetical protein
LAKREKKSLEIKCTLKIGGKTKQSDRTVAKRFQGGNENENDLDGSVFGRVHDRLPFAQPG